MDSRDGSGTGHCQAADGQDSDFTVYLQLSVKAATSSAVTSSWTRRHIIGQEQAGEESRRNMLSLYEKKKEQVALEQRR
jgi:hypothetical protein